MMSTEAVKVKKKMGDYGYKMYSLPEKVMSVAKVISTRDRLSYGELITDALELYLSKYPECRGVVPCKADKLLRTLTAKKDSDLTVELGL